MIQQLHYVFTQRIQNMRIQRNIGTPVFLAAQWKIVTERAQMSIDWEMDGDVIYIYI